MATCYQHTANGDYAGDVEDYGLLPNNATYTAPPDVPWKRVWPRWTGNAWEMVEDHRERSEPYFPAALAQKGTPYWLPEDAWSSSARTAKEPGPLPEGAVLIRPERPLAEVKQDKVRAIDAGYDAAINAAITMPTANPTPGVIARETSALLAVDPDALDSIRAVMDVRRLELMEAVETAAALPDHTAALEAIEGTVVSYPV